MAAIMKRLCTSTREFTHGAASPRAGFTLIEMLVSIAIMAVMVGMMLPAIQNARLSARATQCRSNLSQLGEAFHAYHLTHGSLPCGSVDLRSPAVTGPDRFVWGWAVQLLPYLGEQNRASRLNASLGVFAPVNAETLKQAPVSLSCPSGSPGDQIGYAGCHNDRMAPVQADNNGVLTLNSQVRFEELVDGLHQTLLLGEGTDIRWAEGTSGSLRHFGSGFGEAYVREYVGVTESEAASQLEKVRAEIKAESAVQPVVEKSDVSDDDGGDYPESVRSPDLRMAAGEFLGPQEGDSIRPPSPPVAEPMLIPRSIGFWPAHRDGGNFLLADGSVRVVSRTVNVEVLRRLANRFDHQVVGEF